MNLLKRIFGKAGGPAQIPQPVDAEPYHEIPLAHRMGNGWTATKVSYRDKDEHAVVQFDRPGELPCIARIWPSSGPFVDSVPALRDLHNITPEIDVAKAVAEAVVHTAILTHKQDRAHGLRPVRKI